MEIGLLGSGSKGNATLVRSEGAAFLIDSGLSARAIGGHLRTYGLAPGDLLGIVLTHEHIDHIRSVGTLARRWNLPVWTNRAARSEGRPLLGKLPEWREVEVGVPFEIGGVRLEPFSTPHDAADPFGLVLEAEDGHRIGLATDMGCVTQLARERLRSLQGLVLEFNHDLELLLAGPYPWPVKQRIRGKLGHLNNDDAAALLGEVASDELEWVICCHISKENNTPELVRETARSELRGMRGLWSGGGGARIHLAAQNEPTPLLGPGGPARNGGAPPLEEAP